MGTAKTYLEYLMQTRYNQHIKGSVAITYWEAREQLAKFNPHHDRRGRFARGGGTVGIQSIDKPIEQRNTGKGNPNAVLQFDRPLSNRQKTLLEQLPDYDSRVIVKKESVNMRDLSALTASTGDEFAMFTKQGNRLIIRGNTYKVNVDIEEAMRMAEQGYKWSGHTHPGIDKNCLQASPGDMRVLNCFKQDVSYIYNSKGTYLEFGKG